MRLGQAPTAADVELRARMVRTGCRLTLAIAAAVTVWIVATWSDPHRSTLVVLAVLATVSGVAIERLPTRRLVVSRWGDGLLLGWSAIDVLIVGVAAYADGGVGSPSVLLLFLALIFAALAYPRWMVVVVSAMSLLAVGVLVALTPAAAGGRDAVWVGGLITTLAIAGALCVAQAQIHAEQRQRLHDLSTSDALTRCLNRRGLATRLERDLARCAAEGEPLALLQLDLDAFKAVNDEGGHAAGDTLLAWVGATLAEAVRPGDAVGRIGGDEFAVVLPGASLDEAEALSDRVRLALAARIGASVGVAGAPAALTTPEALHLAADEALYARKRLRAITTAA